MMVRCIYLPRLRILVSIRYMLIAGFVCMLFIAWNFNGLHRSETSAYQSNVEVIAIPPGPALELRKIEIHSKIPAPEVKPTLYQKNVEKQSVIPEFKEKPALHNTSVACVQPVLALDDPVMMKWFKKMPPFECKDHTDLVFVENGTLRYTSYKTPEQTCDMYPILRGPGDHKISFGPPVQNVQDKVPLVSNFFKVVCKSGGKDIYEIVLKGIHRNQTITNRFKSIKPPTNGLGLSVVMLSFDSMSRMSWLRRLPKTRDYFVNKLGAIELEGYNIMGDGTPAALIPILTGKHEQELPEARKAFRGKTVDRYPFIWKDFQKNGYVTSYGDDAVTIGPFHYRLKGFEHSPTDFYLRPFFMAANQISKRYTKGCYGSIPSHQRWLNYARDIFHMYKDNPKFVLHHYTFLSHNDNNRITPADEDIYNMVYSLENGGFLENTLFVLFGDHGARFSNVRATLSGKLEERNAYVAIHLPKSFREKNPHLMANLRTNSKRLTTPLDLHETLKDMLRFDGARIGDVKNRAISLFKEIPKERTCGHADIAPHWCACLSWKPVAPSDQDGQRALQKAVDVINGFTSAYRQDCAELKILNVTSSNSLRTSESVLRFKQTTGDRGLEPIMSDKSTKQNRVVYQFTFFTTPGAGQFEMTLEHAVNKNEMTVDPKAISRVNKYGDAPACILDRNREIRQYCYCNNLLPETPNK